MRPRRLSLFRVAGLLACCTSVLCITGTNASALTIVRYLDGVGDGSDVSVALLKVSAPTDSTLDNFDPARNPDPGLTIRRGGSGLGESDPTKYQLWRIPAGGTTINGNVSLTIWNSLKKFESNHGASVRAFLVECNPDGTGIVPIDSVTVTRPDWDAFNTKTWIQDTFNFGIVNYTVNSGKSVGFKLIVASTQDDVWFAYDTVSYPSRGQFTILAPGISVNPTSGLTTTEGGGTGTFTVVLDSQPTADVTVGISSSDLTEGTVAPASLTFTPGDWNTARTVTVTGVDDILADGNVAYTIVTAAATSTDGSFNGLDPADVGVTNLDDDTAGITVMPTSGLATTEGGGTATFTVVLDSQPTADVTIGLSSSDLTEGTVGPPSLTFTSGNWNSAQTVTVTGVDDLVADDYVTYTIVTAAATSADASYNGMNASDVGVTNADDDTAGITVTPTTGLTTTEAGGAATFTVVLTSQPTANVTIGLSSGDLTEGTVAPPSVTFTPSNWDTAQTVTVRGVDDLVADGNVAYNVVTAAATSADSTYNGMDAADVGVTNTDDDTAGITVTPTSGLNTTEGGGTAAFAVVLTSQPTANVTIGLSSSDLTEGTVAPPSVTFTPSNWDTAQTVTVTGVNDFGVDGPVGYTIVTAAANSADGGYNGTDPADVGVTNTDDDTAGITVTPTSGLNTTEGGGTATFTVVLTSQPTADVTIGLSSSDLTEGTVAPPSVTFTPSNWDTAQMVTVTGVDDLVADGNVAHTIVTAAATSADGTYNGLDPADVSVTNADNETPGITVTPTLGLTTTESGGTATFTVVLDTQPTANVTIGLSSGDLTEGAVAPPSVTFTPSNWDTAQTVTVMGVDDLVADGSVAYNVVTAAATSADSNYNGLDPADVSVTNTDNDMPGITVTPTSGLTTTEAGGTATFTVVLTSQPTANVTIGLSSSDLTEGTVAPLSVTFTPANWDTAQTVTVTGVNDLIADGNTAYTIVTAAAVSSDGAYSGLDPADVSVTNADNDTPGITVTPTSGLTTTESGGTATFSVVLDTQPAADVTIGLSSSDLTEGTVAPTSLTFTSTDWNTPQVVTVTGVNDAAVDGAVAYAIVTAAATSADGNYSGFDPADVSVTNADNDTRGITVTPTSGLTTTEAGGTATFTVVLDTQPAADVTIGLSSSDPSEGTVSPASMTFTAADWNTPQTVTVTGVNDILVDGDVAYAIVTAPATSADGNYNGLDPADVAVTNLNDDTTSAVDLRLSADRDPVESGQPVRYTLEIRNRTPVTLTNFEVQNELPPRFGYLPGTATRDGRAIADPAGSRVQRFALDSLAAFTDLNGDGQAGPGEPGYLALSWALVPGASATPGAYVDGAVAFAGCTTCAVSNRVEATVQVEEDQLLARGTVVGRVFEDTNRDGLQGRDEKGLAGAVVMLDDGTSVGTDAEGRFHLPDVDPGPHVVKLDMERLGMPAIATTETAPVAYVSQGLLSSVRFGVSFQSDSLEIGRPPVSGVAIVTEEMDRSAIVAGNALRAALVVNGVAVRLRTVDARLSTAGLSEVLRLDGDRLREPAAFTLEVSDGAVVRDWALDVRNQLGGVVWSSHGRGEPPRQCSWDGAGPDSSKLEGGQVYEYQFRVTYDDGLEMRGPRRAFGVDRGTSIAMTMTGDSFEEGRATLTPEAVRALAELAKALRRSPSEKVVVEGHTDAVGSPAANLALSRARAEAAVRYLVERERIPRSRLVVLAFGRGRPVASNATPEGRELNRRIEIHGQGTEVQRARLYDVYRGEASARVGGLSVPVDSAGRFSCSVPLPPGDTLGVTLSDRQGRTANARVRLPRLEIVEPRGEARIPYGGTAPGVAVGPRGADGGPPRVAGAGAAPREQAAARVTVSGRTDPGNRVEVDGVAVPVARSGEFSREVPLHVGENGIALVVRDSVGTLRVENLVVRVLDRADDGQDLVVVERVPNLTVALPPAASVLSSRELRLIGKTEPGYRVSANAESLHVGDDGAFSGIVTLPEGKSTLKIAVEDPGGHRGEIDRPIDVRSKRLFLVALADGVIGKTTGSAVAGAGQSDGIRTEGRLAYRLRGWIAGRYLVTSAFDSRRREFGEIFKDLDDSGRDRLLVNLDPDRLYPVYGDSSAVAYSAPVGGRFFLAVEGEAFRASVGDFPISIDEVELAAFRRTLYGAQVRLGSPAGTPDPGRSLMAFGAAAREVHVLDQIRATGGTLYYLSHRDILEGSIQVSIVVRDRDTGLPLVRYRQVRGGDFNAKEIEGRLVFARPIPSVWDDGSLLGGEQLQGQPVIIEAEYEARGSIEERAAVGGRFRQPIGSSLAVGATVLQDEARAGPYRLWSGDCEVKVGPHARIVGEVAQSEGVAGGTFVSSDGGVSFADADSADATRGGAWKLAADLDVGEWLRKPGRLKVGAFVRRSEPGFMGGNDPGGLGFARHGANVSFETGRWGTWAARFNHEQRLGLGLGDSAAVRDANLLGVQWRRDTGPFSIASEFERRTVDSLSAGSATMQTAAARLSWRPIKPIRTSAERQQTFSGPPNNRTSLGLEWWPLPSLALELKGSDGTTGPALRGGATFTVAGTQLYLREERSEGMGARAGSTLLGAQSALGPMGRTYSEYRWLRDAGETRAQSVVGVERGWRFEPGLLLRLSGEHSSHDRSAGGGSRTAVSSDVSYRGRLPVTATTRGEYRIDGAGGRERQVLALGRLEWSVVDGISARCDYRFSITQDRVASSTMARYEERSFGLAFRPPHSDRVEGLARWTLLSDRRLSAPGDTALGETTMGVTALEATVRIIPGVDWVGKGAVRIRGDARTDPGIGATHSTLWAQRLEYTVRKPFRYGVEYRSLSQREVGDRRSGWLNEVSWDPSQNFRLGVGYNFTSFSGDPLEVGSESSHGWFLRAQSRY